jgi:hypothetical protein
MADYYATVVVGVRINDTKLYEKRTVKAFPHNHPESWKVDPVTGRELWQTKDVFKLDGNPIFVREYDWRDPKRRPKEARAALVHSERDETSRSRRSDWTFVGRLVAHIHVGYREEGIAGIGGLAHTAIGDEKKFLENLLTPLGLWDESEFGIWLVGDVSC